MGFESTLPFVLFILFVIINLVLRAVAIGRKKRRMKEEEKEGQADQKGFRPDSPPQALKQDAEAYSYAQEIIQKEYIDLDQAVHPILEPVESSGEEQQAEILLRESILKTASPKRDLRKIESKSVPEKDLSPETEMVQAGREESEASLWKRLVRLSPLQKAVVLSEILGKPKGLEG